MRCVPCFLVPEHDESVEKSLPTWCHWEEDYVGFLVALTPSRHMIRRPLKLEPEGDISKLFQIISHVSEPQLER